MQFVTVKVFNTAIDAYIIKSRLENEGIECFIIDEHIVTQDPLLNYAVGGIKLKVYQKDQAKANEILREIKETPYLDEEDKVILCPNCASTDIISGHHSMKGIKGFISMFVSFLFMIFPINNNPVYRCNSCGEEFKANV